MKRAFLCYGLEMSFFLRARVVAPLLVLGLVATWTFAGFKTPEAGERSRAVGSLVGMEKSLRKAFVAGDDFEAKKEPGFADWLAQHEETGQTFDQYVQAKPNRPGLGGRSTLYLLPLGEFAEEVSPDLEVLKRHMTLYYAPMSVKILPMIPEQKVPVSSRENSMTNRKQWHTGEMLRWLKSQLPRDAYGLLAVTMTDLYPGENWNFVFGQATYKNRVGVFSFARFHPQLGFGDAEQEDADFVALRRACKVLTHEMGHMFGIKHCIYYECNMNGANSLPEMDSTPMHLCPVCLRKLQSVVGFDPVGRYEELEGFYQKEKFEKELQWVKGRVEFVKEDE